MRNLKAIKPHRKALGLITEIALFLLLFLILFIIFGLLWLNHYFGNITLEEIIYTINMPLDGADNKLVISFIKRVILPTGALFVILVETILLIQILGKVSRKALNICLSVFLSVCLISVAIFSFRQFAVSSFISSRIHKSTFIEDNYVDTAKTTITFPEKKRNLIWIYMESAESTLQDKASGGIFDENLIPEMTKLEQEGISFSQSESYQGAAVATACGWTISGLVAQNAGLPLKLIKYGDGHGKNATDASMKKGSIIFPVGLS